ncbi:MarR family transcriptional regulator [Streptomyces sp. SID5785]|uniref:MarR family transcriptional regulator n=1 Tax=Streptomyces sp. SID5785 TaxID=2690309 RepID=UPI0013619776|nr:MarR family transcriptional regulator [Streptomyces sp. SID5785]MZD08256.1 MarR family transcriptional regulator [Streptomyces sp. SID5785]
MSINTAPAADSRALGLAHYAARGVLERVLSGHDVTFLEQVTLRAAATDDAPPTPDDLVRRVEDSLKAEPAAVRAVIGTLLAKKLLSSDGSLLRPTGAGRDLLAVVATEVAPVSARIWGGIPAADLAAAGRVLAQVKERAEAELAQMDRPVSR